MKWASRDAKALDKLDGIAYISSVNSKLELTRIIRQQTAKFEAA
jgi:hypothetical protein